MCSVYYDFIRFVVCRDRSSRVTSLLGSGRHWRLTTSSDVIETSHSSASSGQTIDAPLVAASGAREQYEVGPESEGDATFVSATQGPSSPTESAHAATRGRCAKGWRSQDATVDRKEDASAAQVAAPLDAEELA